MTDPGDRRVLRVLVAGAGVGGLSAAIRLRRLGHVVTVLEQAPVLGEVGAGIQLAPNATRALDELGVLERLAATAVAAQWSIRRRWEDGRVLGAYPLGDDVVERFGAPYWHAHRRDLHDALVEAACDPALPGPPATLELGQKVIDVQPDAGGQGVLLTAGGGRHVADVVVGADGIHSVVRQRLFGVDQPRDSGDVAYRTLVPASAIMSSPQLRDIAGGATMTIWLGPNRHLVHYYVRSREQLNFVGIVPGWGEARESWSARGDKRDLLASLAGWDPRVRALIEAASEVSCWALYDRDPLDTWTAGRIALLGDAAHAMLPYQAQGAAQAVEDAVALGDAIAAVGDGDVESALKDYEASRRSRAGAVQEASRANREKFHLPDGEAQGRRDELLGNQRGDFDSYEWLWQPSSSVTPRHPSTPHPPSAVKSPVPRQTITEQER